MRLHDRRVLAALATVLAISPTWAQRRPEPKGSESRTAATTGHAISGSRTGTERWIVHFRKRSFSLDRLQAALRVRGGPAPARTIDGIVADYEKAAVADRRAFSTALSRLDGRIVKHWWLVNACCVEVPSKRAREIRGIKGVARIEADQWVVPATRSSMLPTLIEATSASAHNADAAHAAGFHGRGGRGSGQTLSIAVLDTELLTKQLAAPMGVRHHAVLRLGGSTTAASRVLHDHTATGATNFTAANQIPFDHGVSVAAVAAGAKGQYQGADDGQAPGADIVGINVASTLSGTSASSILTSAWQWVTANKAKYNIAVAVNSYSGMPDPTNAAQIALDTCAETANVLVVVAAGNNAQTHPTTPVRFAQYVANGLAVGATSPCAKVLTPFSSRGPLSRTRTGSLVPTGYERQYPDISATGSDQILPSHIWETAYTVKRGTSFAAPHVAGAGYLYIAGHDSSTQTTRTALMAKAALLATAEDIKSQNAAIFQGGNPPQPDDVFGAGYLRTDWLTADATHLALTVNEHSYGPNTIPPTQPMAVTAGETYSIAIAWNRIDFSLTPDWADLDLYVRDSAQRVIASSVSTVPGASNGRRRTWERVRFAAPYSGTVWVQVSFTHVPANTTVRYAQASVLVPTAKKARVVAIGGTLNQNCRTTGWVKAPWQMNTESLTGGAQPKTYTTVDCATPGKCVVWRNGPGERAFWVGGQKGQTLTFQFYAETCCAGILDCYVLDGIGGGAPPLLINPGGNVLARGRLQYPAGNGYLRGEVHVPANAVATPAFLVIKFPPKLNWWDDRFVPWATWHAVPWCYPNTVGGCFWHTKGPYDVWTKNSSGAWLPNGIVSKSTRNWVKIMQWRFAYGWAASGPRNVGLDFVGVPRLGASGLVRLDGCGAGATPVLLAVGLTPTAPLPLGNCYYLVRFDVVLQLASDSSGWAVLPLVIPPDVQLAGAGFELQAAVMDSATRWLSTSNAKRVVAGF